jgi:hypothetical protein
MNSVNILAYVDPGLGALIWQSMAAAVVGLFFYLRKTRQWILNSCLKIFGHGRKSTTAAPAVPAEAPADRKESANKLP